MLSITAALIAALIPVLFMPDVVGRYFREFGITLVAAIVASALVSLSLTPMLCSRFLREGEPGHAARESRLLRGYLRSLGWVLRHRALTVAAALTVTAGSVFLYFDMPKGFMPTQDTGVIYVRTITMSNISFTAMSALQRSVSDAILDDPAVDGLNSYIGTDNGSVLSNGEMLVALKPPAVRKTDHPAGDRAAARPRWRKVEGVRTFFTPIQDLALGVQNSASRYQYTLTGSDPDHLCRNGRTRCDSAMAGLKATLTDVIASNEIAGLQAGLEIDRVRAAAMGVTPLAIDNTLYDAFGQRQIRTIYLPHNYSRVVLEAGPAMQADPASLNALFVPGTAGGQVPLAALTRLGRSHGAMWMVHSGQFPAVTISFDTVPGVSHRPGDRCDPRTGTYGAPARRHPCRIPWRGGRGDQDRHPATAAVPGCDLRRLYRAWRAVRELRAPASPS